MLLQRSSGCDHALPARRIRHEIHAHQDVLMCQHNRQSDEGLLCDLDTTVVDKSIGHCVCDWGECPQEPFFSTIVL